MPQWPVWPRLTPRGSKSETFRCDETSEVEKEYLKPSPRQCLKAMVDDSCGNAAPSLCNGPADSSPSPSTTWGPALQLQASPSGLSLLPSSHPAHPTQCRPHPGTLSLPTFSTSEAAEAGWGGPPGLTQQTVSSSGVVEYRLSPRPHSQQRVRSSSDVGACRQSSPHGCRPLGQSSSDPLKSLGSPQPSQDVLSWQQLQQHKSAMQQQQQQQQLQSQQGMLRAYMAALKAGEQQPPPWDDVASAAAGALPEPLSDAAAAAAVAAVADAVQRTSTTGDGGESTAATAATTAGSAGPDADMQQQQQASAQLGVQMADSIVLLSNQVTSAGRALEQSRNQGKLLQEQIDAMEVELSESQKYNETLEEELARLKKKLGQRSVDMLLLQEQLQEAQEVADRHAEELAVTTAQLSATGDKILQHEALVGRLSLLVGKASVAGQLASRAWQTARRDPYRSETTMRALQAAIEVLTAVTALRGACLKSRPVDLQQRSELHPPSRTDSPPRVTPAASAAASPRVHAAAGLSDRRRSVSAAGLAAGSSRLTGVSCTSGASTARSDMQQHMSHALVPRGWHQQEAASTRHRAAGACSDDACGPQQHMADALQGASRSRSRSRGGHGLSQSVHLTATEIKQQRIQELKQLLLLHGMPPHLSNVRHSSSSRGPGASARRTSDCLLVMPSLGGASNVRYASAQGWEQAPSWARGRHVTPRSHAHGSVSIDAHSSSLRRSVPTTHEDRDAADTLAAASALISRLGVADARCSPLTQLSAAAAAALSAGAVSPPRGTSRAALPPPAAPSALYVQREGRDAKSVAGMRRMFQQY